ncbi:bifunctional DNA primase/polymerase-like protein [Halopolyspora algeriensis]|uniref:Bifunctional DNA primase/polymerase-like protein n=1 Tax=Halopolyspora algeriensis TaxID=1500506 RepID=A0A368W2C9_9ACTN|nr:bifunctional DNA primase/polymerase [Halopolyspora algeriensis]RCW46843.1 bifunctional DNA primase/polymerase-like protein [Halopolyspora algeriensis]TQM47934.1 bifunctional DNA primase/polymerase-like protein [Halopolyspora algeriensis]
MNTRQTQLLRSALHLAEQRWAVLPLLPGSKRPAVRQWEQRATTDPDRITRCWQHAAYNIGLACGPSGLVVVDCDEPEHGQALPDHWQTLGLRSGAEILTRLARRAGEPLPPTYTVATPSGGWHLYFLVPAAAGLRNTAGTLGPLLDTRAAGGYVVAPGSVLDQGAYELYDDTDPARLPGWLAQALTPKPSTGDSAPSEIAPMHRSAYVEAALRNEAERVAAAQPGKQNITLFTASLALGRLVAGGAVDVDTVRAVLHRAMSRLPQTKPEPWTAEAIDATIRSGLRTAANRPRRLTDRKKDAA